VPVIDLGLRRADALLFRFLKMTKWLAYEEKREYCSARRS
jgi:hypothetical protein